MADGATPAGAPRLAGLRMLDGGAAIAVSWSDGVQARFHARWLRDNALDEATRDPGNGQRRVSVRDLPDGTRAGTVALAEGDVLRVRFEPDGRETCHPGAWLRTHLYDRGPPAAPGWCAAHVACWGAEIAEALPQGDLRRLREDRGALAAWLAQVRRHGFALLRGVPCEPGTVCEVVSLFGFVRETQYGRCFDVRAEVKPINLAYTSLGLAVHTDNPYRDPVPTLQLLACLESDVDGGDSTLVDGFRAARILREESPDAFDCLTRWCARFEYAGAPGVRLAARRPVIELAPDGELVAVRWNDRSASPLVDVPFDAMPGYYEALRRFAGILDRPELAVRFRLAPGDAFIVDNTRVLHGRTAWSGSGRRWLQGCYADRDGLLSTLAALEHDAA